MSRRTILTTLVFVSALSAAAPSTPTGFEASDGAIANQVSLSWNHSRGVSVYRIFRSRTTDFAGALSLGITESIVFTDTVGTTEPHFYWLRAENSEGVSPLAGPVRGRAATGSAVPVGINIGALLNPPPTANPMTGAKIYLGKTLFWDEQLSSTRTTACGTCHRFRAGGTDPRSILGDPRSTHPGKDRIPGNQDDVTGSRGVPLTAADGSYLWSPLFGVHEQVTERRAMPVLDTTLAPQGLLWDGKASASFVDPETNAPLLAVNAAAENQALLPLLNTAEMAHQNRTIADVVARVRESRPLALAPSIPVPLAEWLGSRSYADLFEEAFGTPVVTPARIAMAIASYERSLQADRFPNTSTAINGGFPAFVTGGCAACHTPGQFTNGNFQATGVSSTSDDPGRGGISGSANDIGRFRTPGLRGVGLRTTFQHNGRFGTLRDVIEFYNRGGDFPAPGLNPNQIRPLNLTEQQKQALESFLHHTATDPRLANEAGPLFDRPMLYSESARVPEITGDGRPARNGAIPEAIAIEPPYAGNPNFTVAIGGVPPGEVAVLAIDANDPGTGGPPTTVSFLSTNVTTANSGTGVGFASFSFPLPEDIAGMTLTGRWYVAGGVSRAFRFTVFPTERSALPPLISLPAASLAQGMVAPDSLVSSFGSDLANAAIEVTDAAGAKSSGLVSFSSPSQINYLLPAGVAPGEATVRAMRDGVSLAEGKLEIARVAPGIFTANSDGRDAPAALVFRSGPGGPLSALGVWRFDNLAGRHFPAPIQFSQQVTQIVLVLHGTGIRHGKDVRVTIGGVEANVAFAGPQGQFEGLDQINVDVPSSLAGRGEVAVQVTVDGIRANPVRVLFQ